MFHSLSIKGVRAIAFALACFLPLGGSPALAGTPLRFADVFEKLTWRPGEFAELLAAAPLVTDLDQAVTALPGRLPEASLRPVPRSPGDLLRIGTKGIPVPEAALWRHFEGSPRLWIDVLTFDEPDGADRVFAQRRQGHSGRTHPDYFIFIAYGEAGGLDVVGAVVRNDRCLLNLGLEVPFSARDARTGSMDELRSLDEIVGRFVGAMEALTRQLVVPDALADAPSGPVTDQERRVRRLASFARLWSEVKYNFVFLNERPDVDWDGLLERYMARVLAADSQAEYRRILAEALALLRDGHTGLTDRGFGDRPAVRVRPVGGRPVVTAVGSTPELSASGLLPGMELVAIDGRPVDEVLEQDIYPVVAASTPQGRDVVAFQSLLWGETDTSVSATVLDLGGDERTFDLMRDSSRHPGAFQPRSLVECRPLAGGLFYAALNSFGDDRVVTRFDECFPEILESRGLIIDVRRNGGGSSLNGFAVIARLIAEPTTQTSVERTRVHKGTERARGRPEEWQEYPRDRIEPRGERPYLGPVAVLTGAETFSAAEDFLVPLRSMGRATFIGLPTAGSTGQPLMVPLYGANARICTKWDRFPDGTEFVGVGISPDIRVEPTRADIAAGRDPVLDRAVAFLLDGAGQQALRGAPGSPHRRTRLGASSRNHE